jgi:hypothetical protein
MMASRNDVFRRLVLLLGNRERELAAVREALLKSATDHMRSMAIVDLVEVLPWITYFDEKYSSTEAMIAQDVLDDARKLLQKAEQAKPGKAPKKAKAGKSRKGAA